MDQGAPKKPCAYCGASPAPHAFLFVDTTITIFCGRTLRIMSAPVFYLLAPLVVVLTNIATHGVFTIFEKCGWLTYEDTYIGDHLDRKQVMFEEAKKRGIRIQNIRMNGRSVPQARAWMPRKLGAPPSWQYFEFIPIPPWKENVRARDIDNKEEFKKVMRKNGLKVPYGAPVFSVFGARRLFKNIRGPVIVKPLEGSRSRHTRINVATEAELRDAVMKARQICPMMMVEECIQGEVYRATCVDGKVAGVMELVRPKILADGIKTADELRQERNAHPDFETLTPIEDDQLFAFTLAHQGLTRDTVPEKGTELVLAEFSERVNGGYFIDVTKHVPASIIAYLEKGARACAIPVIGFDVISKDITDASEPVTFLEGNTAPFIEIHHIPYKGEVQNVAGKVWDMWLS